MKGKTPLESVALALLIAFSGLFVLPIVASDYPSIRADDITLFGTVENVSGTGITFIVSVYQNPGSGGGWLNSTETDSEGNFEVNISSSQVGTLPPVVTVESTYLYSGSSVTLNDTPSAGDSINVSGLYVSRKPTGTLIVNVTSLGAPLEGAIVRVLDGSGYSAVTNSTGQCRFTDVVASPFPIRVSAEKEHYNPAVNNSVYIVANTTNYANIDIVEKPLPVNVVPSNGTMNYPVVGEVYIYFFQAMNASSLNKTNIVLMEYPNVEVNYTINITPNSNNRSLRLIHPPFKYNTRYIVIIKKEVTDVNGDNPLWKDYITEFTTEKGPATIYGWVYLRGTTIPAPPNTTIKVNGLPKGSTDANGYFEIGGIRTYGVPLNVSVENSYLYWGSFNNSVVVQKGDRIEVKDLWVEKKPTGTVMVVVSSGEDPLEGAKVSLLGTPYVNYTDSRGIATFYDVVAGTLTIIVEKEHYTTGRNYSVVVREDEVTQVHFNLRPSPLPVSTTPEDGEDLVPVNTNITITFYEDILISTVNSNTFKLLEGGTVPVSGEIHTISSRQFIFDPSSDLKHDTDYVIYLSTDIRNSTGARILWRELRATFHTAPWPPAYIRGYVKSAEDGEGIAGVIVRCLDSEDRTDEAGMYQIMLTPSSEVMSDLSVEFNGSSVGYTTYVATGVSVRAGEVLEFLNVTLEMIKGRYSTNPEDGAELVPVDVNIEVRFDKPLKSDDPNVNNWFALSPLGHSSLKIHGNVSFKDGDKTAVFDPEVVLSYGTPYRFYIYNSIKYADGTSALWWNESIVFTTEPKPIEITVIQPTGTINVSQTEPILIQFSKAVDTDLVNSSIAITPNMPQMNFSWSGERVLTITHGKLPPSTTYNISLPGGLRYGKNGARLLNDWFFTFTTGNATEYQPSISLEGGVIYSGMEFTPGERHVLRGSADNAEGYRVNVSVGGKYYRGVVQNGKWQVEIQLPTKEGKYTIVVKLEDPLTGNIVDEKSVEVVVKEKKSPLTLPIIILAVVIVFLVVAFLAMRAKIKGEEGEVVEMVEEFVCPECGEVVPADATVCPHCGAEFADKVRCPHCGALVPADVDICPKCGEPVAEEMELEEEEEYEME
ncbi:MAG: Ig-like domain-containing protein [Thermoplasmata archaeon]|nr:Ig-like domain-containing protein [Thermoplasmata archaeon]